MRCLQFSNCLFFTFRETGFRIVLSVFFFKIGSVVSRQKPLTLREVSNPRLASSHGLHHSASISEGSKLPKKTGRSRESTFLSVGGRSGKGFSITPVPEDKVSVGAPEKVLNKPSTRSLGED